MFDPKCKELALYFLDDKNLAVEATADNVQRLAEAIQDAVEDWLAEQED
jgi:hypothetical protein